MKYAFIHSQRQRFNLTRLCRLMRVSRSGYYSWLQDPIGKRGRQDQILKPEVLRVFSKHKRIYGSPRISAKLKKEGILVGENRVARLMREMGLRSIIQRKHKATTNSKHNKPVARNRLNRRFRPARINQAWAGDITYIQTKQGWLYLAIVMDLYSRKIIGWAMSDRINTSLVERALESALAQRTQHKGMLFHSDRGVQYASDSYQALLSQHKIINSMSRKGNCWDNAVVESFFHSLKQEWLHHRNFTTREEARTCIFEYIEGFYNNHRLHSTLGYKSPVEYEMLMAS